MPTCYCVQEPSLERDRVTGNLIPKDLSSAQRYGTVVFLLSQEDKPSLTTGPCARKIAQGLKNFKPEDYLFFAGGDPHGYFIAGNIMTQLGFSEVNTLRWEREIDAATGKRLRSGFYVPALTRLNINCKD